MRLCDFLSRRHGAPTVLYKRVKPSPCLSAKPITSTVALLLYSTGTVVALLLAYLEDMMVVTPDDLLCESVR